MVLVSMSEAISMSERAEAAFWSDLGALTDQIGVHATACPDGAMETLCLEGVQDAAGLESFLRLYRDQILAPIEFPTILQASVHAGQGEWKALLALDQRLAEEPAMRFFAQPSRLMGRGCLRRLRGLRDVRVLQRYDEAVRDGRAHGWHTVVYGLVLSIFSIPLRQGLVNYQYQILQGFLRSASKTITMKDTLPEGMLAGIEALPMPKLDSPPRETDSTVIAFPEVP